MDFEKLKEMYHLGTPMEDISFEFGFTKDYLRRLLRKNGVLPRCRTGLPALQKTRSRFENWKPSDIQKQIIIGSLLGDGTLGNPNRCGANRFTNSFLRIMHSSKQKDYVIWKAAMLKEISCPVHSYVRPDGGRHYFQTFSCPYFTSLHWYWYICGIKIIPDMVNELDALGLAIWYMDDGTYGVSKGSEYGFLCTDSFTYGDQELLQNLLHKRFGISTSHVKTNKTQHRLRISANGIRVLREVISPYVIPSMKYKLGC